VLCVRLFVEGDQLFICFCFLFYLFFSGAIVRFIFIFFVFGRDVGNVFVVLICIHVVLDV